MLKHAQSTAAAETRPLWYQYCHGCCQAAMCKLLCANCHVQAAMFTNVGCYHHGGTTIPPPCIYVLFPPKIISNNTLKNLQKGVHDSAQPQPHVGHTITREKHHIPPLGAAQSHKILCTCFLIPPYTMHMCSTVPNCQIQPYKCCSPLSARAPPCPLPFAWLQALFASPSIRACRHHTQSPTQESLHASTIPMETYDPQHTGACTLGAGEAGGVLMMTTSW